MQGTAQSATTFDAGRLNSLPTLSFDSRIGRNANTLFSGYKLAPETLMSDTLLTSIRKVTLVTQVMADIYTSTASVHVQMFASLDGYLTIYPVYGWSQPFEVRLQPWFRGAVSYMKPVILLLDLSGTMVESERMNTMKTAAKALVEALADNDLVNVVGMTSSMVPPSTPKPYHLLRLSPIA